MPSDRPKPNPQSPRTRRAARFLARLTLTAVVIACVGVVYFRGATAHAARANAGFIHPSNYRQARASNLGDQSSYMKAARDLYFDRHEGTAHLTDRNRMPLYSWLQSFFYEPRPGERGADRYTEADAERDDAFFERGKRVNVWLSMAILVALYLIFRAHVGTLAGASAVLVLAFGVCVFKAGYFQSELLYYFTSFVAFLLICHFLKRPRWWLAPLVGVAAAVAHLTKAGMLPLVAIFVAVFLAREVFDLFARMIKPGRPRPVGVPAVQWRVLAMLLCLASFVAVLWPYISNSKRQFGQYFYNVNSTFYIWYDRWPDVSVRAPRDPRQPWGTKAWGDREHWPDVADENLPGPGRYWRDHSWKTIGDRVEKGFELIWTEPRDKYGVFYYAWAFIAVAALLLVVRPIATWRMTHSNRNGTVPAFLLLYLAAYLPLTAFYWPISQTGVTRFLFAHLAPLFFVLTYVTAREPYRSTGIPVWRRIRITPAWFHVAVIVSLYWAIPYYIWPRLIDPKNFGGF
jgi:hypothetical protein